jgi:hypothetical protein
VRRGVDVVPERAASDTHGPRGCIHLDVLHVRQIDHEAVVADAKAGGVVAAAADRDRHPVVGAGQDRGGDIGPSRHIAIARGRLSIIAL